MRTSRKHGRSFRVMKSPSKRSTHSTHSTHSKRKAPLQKPVPQRSTWWRHVQRVRRPTRNVFTVHPDAVRAGAGSSNWCQVLPVSSHISKAVVSRQQSEVRGQGSGVGGHYAAFPATLGLANLVYATGFSMNG